jgi:hypothetical protein
MEFVDRGEVLWRQAVYVLPGFLKRGKDQVAKIRSRVVLLNVLIQLG